MKNVPMAKLTVVTKHKFRKFDLENKVLGQVKILHEFDYLISFVNVHILAKIQLWFKV